MARNCTRIACGASQGFQAIYIRQKLKALRIAYRSILVINRKHGNYKSINRRKNLNKKKPRASYICPFSIYLLFKKRKHLYINIFALYLPIMRYLQYIGNHRPEGPSKTFYLEISEETYIKLKNKEIENFKATVVKRAKNAHWQAGYTSDSWPNPFIDFEKFGFSSFVFVSNPNKVG